MADEPLQVKQGETAYIDVVFTDRAGAAQDPSVSQQIRITAPPPASTLLVTDAAMSDLTGVDGGWTYAYQVGASAILGVYSVEAIGKDGATPDVSMGQGEFEVIKRIGP